jgi:hypothetical protein
MAKEVTAQSAAPVLKSAAPETPKEEKKMEGEVKEEKKMTTEEQVHALSRRDSGVKKIANKHFWMEAKRAKSPEIRRRMENGEPISKWMEDHEAQACMVCDKQFGFFLRKHHCRRCGIIVCDSCSSKKVRFANKSQEKRVCDVCFELVQKLENAGMVDSKEGITDEEVEPPTNDIPNWMFAFKPFSRDGYKINIGTLYLRIYEAKDLPVMDFGGLSDPYVVINVGDYESKTAVMSQTLNPKWATAEFLIPISCAQDIVTLNIFDQDIAASDDKMGIVEVPLSGLTHSKTVRKWYDLKLEAEVAKGLRAKSKDGVYPAPRILVEMQYTFSAAGELFSYFTPRPMKPVPQPDFQITIMLNAVFRLLTLLGPIFWLLDQVGKVIMWTDVFKSVAVLTIFCFCTLNPWAYPILFQSLLLYFMAWKFVESKLDSSFIGGSELPGNVREMEKQLKEKIEEGENGDKKKDQPMDSMLTGLASKSLFVTGMQDTLKWLQNMLVFICDILEMIWNLFNWTNPIITQSIAIVVLLTDIWSLFFSFKWIAFIAGFYVLTLYTTPGVTFMWLIMSTMNYVFRPQPKFNAESDLVEFEGNRQPRSSLLPLRTN